MPRSAKLILRWRIGQKIFLSNDPPRLMGIINLTPDSFSDGGRLSDTNMAVEAALRLAQEGADLLDLGAESTRPGATPVSAEDELSRLIPVLRKLRPLTDRLISIDTMKAEVAEQALEAGADVINDVSGLRFDDRMTAVCAASSCGVIIMHMQGTPQTMQLNPHYDEVVEDLLAFFSERLESLEKSGIDRERIVLDPGIGFGKTAEDNLRILQNIPRFRSLGRPVLIGHSRKRFLGKLLNRPLEERSAGTIGVSIAAAALGADYLRLHDVAANRDALAAWKVVTGATGGA